MWTLDLLLMAAMVDELRWLHWAKTKAGAKGRDAPKPIPRPGIEPAETKVVGSTSTPLDRARDRYTVKRRPAA
ncbi:DUF5361 domain-containing protein [Gordonia sp. PP30]|uniref:DUF5361 domain-containing protein n=1 Tax=Gordonia sp. PP30 TaxID=2935861 RepID=UPI001FFECF87|nr:DUF5361 domain-containing protein [Gordonia sp. PP30]UQE73838.1 DUF5361 domain-containing protein [Gordonia sp. PP30]